MATTRVRKVGGIYKDKNFKSLLKQLNGRGFLAVALINTNCKECIKLQGLIDQLSLGLIHKLPQLVVVYGYNYDVISDENEDDKKQSPPKKEKPKKSDSKQEGDEDKKEQKKLSDSNVLDWEEMTDGHGYAIFLSEHDIQHYKGTFNHDDFKTNILDNVRRFNSSVKTLAGLPAKRQFIGKNRTGIIVETSGTTQQSQIVEVENQIKLLDSKLKIPIYFCKGLTQEMCYVQKGQVVLKTKGLNFTKFIKKVAKK